MAGLITGIDWKNKIPVGGTYTVTGTPTSVTLDTGKADAVGLIFQILRAKADVTADAKGSITGGVLKIENGVATYTMAADDVINWIAF